MNEPSPWSMTRSTSGEQVPPDDATPDDATPIHVTPIDAAPTDGTPVGAATPIDAQGAQSADQPPSGVAAAPHETWFWTDQHRDVVPAAPPTRSGGRAFVAWLLAALLGAGAGSATTYLALREEVGPSGTRLVSPPVTDQLDVPSNQAALVAKEVLPSIVQISVASGLGGGGSGSGVIYTDSGYIVTNQHVVQNATRITVGLPSGEELPATLVGTGAAAGVDLAVLKVDAKGLTPATFGSTRSIAVGDLAVAVGSPFGLDATVTSGIISALHRNREEVNIRDAIQTDAPINPGNSGGALANARGEVVGINTAIFSPGGGGLFGGQGGNVGIGFAIPSEIVRNIADQIIEGKTPQLAYLGVEGSSLPGGKGARISSVGDGTPAEAAGLRSGDVIVEAGGQAIRSMDELISFLIAQKVGTKVSLGIERDGSRSTVEATLAARPAG